MRKYLKGIGILTVLLSVLLSALPSAPILAQEVDEDALFGGSDDGTEEVSDSADLEDDLFGGSEDDLFGGSEDDLFGSDSMVEEVPEIEEDAPEAYVEFLTTEQVQIGGNLSSSLSSFWGWSDLPETGEDFRDNVNEVLGLTLDATVYLDARPSTDLRIFMKGKASYPFTNTTAVLTPDAQTDGSNTLSIDNLNASIFELYTDINLNQQLFFRFGKQAVNWGVGYFWSPADFISLVPIDLEEPENEREGPVAVKATLPLGLHGIEAYVIADETVRKLEDLGYAARGSFYFDFGDIGLETQIGLGYQKDRPFRIMTSFRLPLRGINIFLEGRVSFGRQGGKILSAGEVQQEDTTAYFSGTTGFNLNVPNIFESILDFTFIGQYYFQGEGYDDANLLGPAFISVRLGDLHPSTLENFGKHYTALRLGINELFLKDLDISSLWQANWSDLSGLVISSLSYEFFDGFTLGFAVINGYGGDSSEYGKVFGPATRKNPFGKLAFRVTLDIGGGRF